MLKALATHAGRDRLDERFEPARLQTPQDSGIAVVVDEPQELRRARRVMGQGHLGEPTHVVEMIAVRIDEHLARSLHCTGEDTLLVKVFREGPDQRRKIHVVLRISRRQLEKLEP